MDPVDPPGHFGASGGANALRTGLFPLRKGAQGGQVKSRGQRLLRGLLPLFTLFLYRRSQHKPMVFQVFQHRASISTLVVGFFGGNDTAFDQFDQSIMQCFHAACSLRLHE